jgi:crotonobetainyl-CoA:carnitine CoA-transferase CaiB-like acyl-CoA transferase
MDDDINSGPLPARSLALSGIRVLDLSRVLAAPWAGQMLSDLVADVIKVERSIVGDDSRNYGPAWIRDGAGAATRESSFYLAANRNKRSVTVDFSKPEGRLSSICRGIRRG